MTDQTSKPQSRHEFESHLIAKAWKDKAFKQELLNNAKAVYARELGQQFPESIQIQVIEETPTNLYLVLPRTPGIQVTEELSEEALEAVAGGGTAKPNVLVSVVVSVLV